MHIRLFLSDLAKKGVSVDLSGENLSLKGKLSALDEMDKDFIRNNKSDIVRYLREKQLLFSLTASSVVPKHFPLSISQKGLWIASQSEVTSTLYNMPSAYFLEGDVDVNELQLAFQSVCARHILLHSKIKFIDGEPFWEPQRDVPEILPISNVDHHDFLEMEMKIPFDLHAEFPIRAHISEGDGGKYLFVTTHHLALDMLSVNVILDELKVVYESHLKGEKIELPTVDINYADYSKWQTSDEYAEILSSKVDEYSNWVSKFPYEHNLILSNPRPAIDSNSGGHFRHSLDTNSVKKLKEACQKNSATLFMGWHAIASKAFSVLSGQDKITLGLPISNRPDERLSRSVGFYINTLAVPSSPGQDFCLDTLIKSSKDTLEQAYKYQDIPFSMLVEKVNPPRSTSTSPIVQIVIGMENGQQDEYLQFGDAKATPVHQDIDNARFDITLTANVTNEGIVVDWEYKKSIFSAERIEKFARYLNEVLIVLAGEGEFTGLAIQDNTSSDYAGKGCSVTQLFSTVVKENPDKIAITGDTGEATYAQLNSISNKIAHFLMENDTNKSDRVAVILPRGVNWIMSVLGVLKAGCSYVPISVEYDNSHVESIVKSAGVKFVITDLEIYQSLDCVMDLPFLLMDDEIRDGMLTTSEADVEESVSSSDEAYLMYTSGTTGKPKGIAIPHSGIVRLAANQVDLKIDANSRMLHASNVTFDATTFEVWTTLLNGGQVIASKNSAIHIDSLKKLINKHKANVTFFTAKVLDVWANALDESSTLKHIVAGGEIVSNKAVETLYKKGSDFVVYNGYGPTENTTFTTYYKFPRNTVLCGKNPPIGRPITATGTVVIGKNGKPAPICGRGEIVVFGDGVGIGYVGVSDDVARKFKDLSINGKTVSAYYTGDLGYVAESGLLHISGRNDSEVKLRGFRVDVLQVRAAIEAIESIDVARVVFRKDLLALVAYVTSKDPCNDIDIKSILKTQLPDYMIPQFILFLNEMPTTSVGKVDEKAFLQFDDELLKSNTSSQPSSGTEIALHSLWENILGHNNFGIDDYFFDIGGNSIYATQMLLDIQSKMGKKVSLKDIFTSQNIRNLSLLLDSEGNKNSEDQAMEIVNRNLPHPCSNAQKRLWNAEKSKDPDGQYSIAFALKIPKSVDCCAIEVALKNLVNTHLIFRTRYFESTDGQVMQEIMQDKHFEVGNIELASYEDANAVIQSENKRIFDLSNDFSLFAKIGRIKDTQETFLFMTIHHIAFDGWSMPILAKAISDEYTAVLDGKEPSSAGSELQYIDYAAWEQSDDGQLAYEEGLSYWTEKLKNCPKTSSFPKLSTVNSNKSQGAILTRSISNDLLSSIEKFCNGSGHTLFTYLYACLSTTLHRYTGQEDIVVGSAQSNRSKLGTENMIGFFVNPVPLRVEFKNGLTFSELLANSQGVINDAFEFQSTPMDEVARSLGRGKEGFFQVMLTLQNNKDVDLTLGDGEFDIIESDKSTSENDVTLVVHNSNDGLVLKWIYDANKFDIGYLNAIADTFEALLNILMSNFEVKIGEADLSCKHIPEYAQYPEVRFEERFKAVTRDNPDSIALRGSRNLSYNELDKKSSQLANYLIEMGVCVGDRVGLLMRRDIDVPLAILAITKAGAAYVPLDVNSPESRVSLVIDSAKIQSLITNIDDLPNSMNTLDVVNLNDVYVDLDDFSDAVNLDVSLSVDMPFYVIHTSGSTGKPKGVVNTHRNVSVYLEHAQGMMFDNVRRTGVVTTSLAFDATITTLLTPLMFGGCVELIPDGEEIDMLSRIPERNEPAVFKLTPSHIEALINNESIHNKSASEHCFVIGGEKLNKDTASYLLDTFPKSLVINEYGPTEATVGCVSSIVNNCNGFYDSVEIGFPHVNTGYDVVCSEGGRQPLFARGELVLYGDNIASGYLTDGQIDSSSFRKNGEACYYTGDIVFDTDTSGLVFVGRTDSQFKVRGYRIESDEICSVLKMHDSVAEVKIDLDDDASSLSAFCLLSKEENPELSSALMSLEYARNASTDSELFEMPDGSHILGINRLETEYLHEEIIRDATYNRHGIEIPEGGCVFDVGANIGFFSYYLANTFNNIRIFSFEPIGPVFNVLKANAIRTNGKITPICEGLADKGREDTFRYYPNVTVFSGVRAGHKESLDTIKGFLKHTDENLDEGDVDELLDTRFKAVDIPVKLSTLSHHIELHNIERIDLLKIDVERCEMDVLRGIKDEHWTIIKQIVVEVHDQGNNVEKVCELLTHQGFNFVVDQNSELGGTELVNIYAKRDVIKENEKGFDYVIKSDKKSLSCIRNDIKLSLKRELPEYMIPSNISFVSGWPLTTNGKVDFKKLRSFAMEKTLGKKGTMPNSEVSIALSEAWRSIFELDNLPSMEDDFFDLGGHSLLLMKLTALIRNKWDADVTLKDIYENSSLKDLSSLIEAKLALASMNSDSQDIEEDGTEVEF